MWRDDELSGIIKWLNRRARKYHRNIMDAEDLVEETIYRLLRHREHIDRSRPLLPLLSVIMENLYKNEYERRKRVLFTDYDYTDNFISDRCADEGARLRDIGNAFRFSKNLNGIECLRLYTIGYSYKEISAIKKIPVGTVQSRISNGRKILRKLLE